MPLRILAISGSLRARSSNTAVLRAAAAAAPADVVVTLYDGLASLPHFNPDDDLGEPPATVAGLRARIGAADGLLFCSPEYAHGVPGSLKNALDWLVSSVEFPNKPVALINASPMATHAQASLIETLSLMTARIVDEATVTIPVSRADVDAAGTITNAEVLSAIRAAMEAFAGAIMRDAEVHDCATAAAHPAPAHPAPAPQNPCPFVLVRMRMIAWFAVM